MAGKKSIQSGVSFSLATCSLTYFDFSLRNIILLIVQFGTMKVSEIDNVAIWRPVLIIDLN